MQYLGKRLICAMILVSICWPPRLSPKLQRSQSTTTAVAIYPMQSIENQYLIRSISRFENSQ